MRLLKILTLCALILVPCFVRAECPTQQTTVVFINGVWATDDEAQDYKDELRERSYSSGVNRECVTFDYSHTQDNGKVTDIIEAMSQWSNQLRVNFSQLVRMSLRIILADTSFGKVLEQAYNQNVGETNDTQLALHLAKFKELTLNQGKRGVIVSHSQGGFYANELWHQLNQTEKTNTRLVSVATPATEVADGGPNTRLARDGVANLFFANALFSAIPNTGLCKNETWENPLSWECHGFDTGYLNDLGAREQIISDIKDVLPTEVLPHASILYDGSILELNNRANWEVGFIATASGIPSSLSIPFDVWAGGNMHVVLFQWIPYTIYATSTRYVPPISSLQNVEFTFTFTTGISAFTRYEVQVCHNDIDCPLTSNPNGYNTGVDRPEVVDETGWHFPGIVYGGTP